MQAIKLGNFLVGTHQGNIYLSREGTDNSLLFNSGEADRVKELLGLALSMESLSKLPEHIDIDAIQIRFHPDNTLTLCTTGEREGEVNFTWIEGDELITRVEDGYKMAMNEREVGSANTKPITSTIESGEPFI
jgi:hypothetical protein